MPPALVIVTNKDRQITGLNAPARSLLGDCEGQCCCEVLKRESPCDGQPSDAYVDLGSASLCGVVGPLAVSNLGEQRVLVLQPRAVLGHAAEPLSPRERDVLRLVARGMTDQRVADALGLRPGTVRTHVENLRRKLGVRTRAQAVAGAIATGLVEG